MTPITDDSLYNNDVHAPVFKLSPEIISEIFLVGKAQAELQAESIHPSKHSKNPIDRSFLVNITRVCRLWRGIALDTLELWATIKLDQECLEWGKELVKRSNGAPLRLFMNEDSKNLDHTDYWTLASRLLSESDRLLEVSVHSSISRKPLKHLSTTTAFKSAPLLQRLDIYILQYRAQGPPSCPVWDSMPSLRTLRLRISKLPELPSLPSLTHLHLGAGKSFSCDVPILKLLQFFQTSPHLEVVSVAFSVAREKSEQPQKDVRISLPRLRSLSFDFVSDFQSQVLKHLEFPASASIHTSYPSHRELSNDGLSLLQEVVFPASRRLLGSPIHMISLSYREDHDWSVHIFEIKVSLQPGTEDLVGHKSEAISLSLPMPRGLPEEAYSPIVRSLPFPATSSLKISNYVFPTLFSLANCIRFLEISSFHHDRHSGNGARTLSYLLNRNNPLGLPCPQLEVITISHSTPYQRRLLEENVDMYDVLINVVNERRSRSPLRLVRLAHCRIRRSTLEKLERIITVECDEETRNLGGRYYKLY